jgi:hypothetical protein
VREQHQPAGIHYFKGQVHVSVVVVSVSFPDFGTILPIGLTTASLAAIVHHLEPFIGQRVTNLIAVIIATVIVSHGGTPGNAAATISLLQREPAGINLTVPCAVVQLGVRLISRGEQQRISQECLIVQR